MSTKNVATPIALVLEAPILKAGRKISVALAAVEGIRDSRSAIDTEAADGLWLLLQETRDCIRQISTHVLGSEEEGGA